ncbi:hypothetical protein [Desulfovibrio sp.]|uniref:hypothetical protein n=1 Tax=Desulfovibrio sp. TaxID=885 RepID=UPI0025C727F7|nr:hypothetical protein [Desulfovibrio sp.]
MKIFAENDLAEFLEARFQHVAKAIENESDDYLLNVNEVDYVNFQYQRAHVEPLLIFAENLCVSQYEKMIPAEEFPWGFNVRRGESYKKSVIKFHIPFTGEMDLLRCAPGHRLLWTMNVTVKNGEICFDIVNFKDDADEIKRYKDDALRNISQQLNYVTNEVNVFNSSLENKIKQIFESRKKRILANNNILSSLGIPLAKSENVSPTFSIPTPALRKKVICSRPEVANSEFKPEPTLNESSYNDILSLIHEVGKSFERLPSLYANKEEEHLRDHFLMMLEPHFQGSATGETFNKKGKTDILLRYEGKNVFIAECKFWRGKKVFLDTITQLLGYLTWRDSKAAVIFFVPNQDFTGVINTASDVAKEHSNYVSPGIVKDETWANYLFHIDGDRNRLVKLAIMLYHLPRMGSDTKNT